jgi:hypothetical protein
MFMGDHGNEIVLLVCDDEKYSLELMDRLSDSGHRVLGPVTNAAMAMTIASQSLPTVALVASQSLDASGPALADGLMRQWGVRSLLLGREAPEPEDFAEAAAEPEWAAEPARRARLHRDLGLN